MLDNLVANSEEMQLLSSPVSVILLLLQHVFHVFSFLPRASEHGSVALELKFLIFYFCLKLLNFKISLVTEGKAKLCFVFVGFFWCVCCAIGKVNNIVLWQSGLGIPCKQSAYHSGIFMLYCVSVTCEVQKIECDWEMSLLLSLSEDTSGRSEEETGGCC